jgi:hypothetical protein
MPFSEHTKTTVKRRADFTCCWCRDRRNKVDVHHIVPEPEGGSPEEDNAAPLCGSCHSLYGANPGLRKEIRLRRDQWYDTCDKALNPQYGWPIGLDVPLLSLHREVPANSAMPLPGIQFTDRDPTDANNPPLLYVSFHFKRSRFFGQDIPDEGEKWLYVEANMRFALNLRIQVRAANDRDVYALMGFLAPGDQRYLPEFVRRAPPDLRAGYIREQARGWALYGLPPQVASGSADYLRLWLEGDETRLMISTFTSTHAGISIHARLSGEVVAAFAKYLQWCGFANSAQD